MPVSGDTGLPIAPRNTHWHGSDARRRVVDFYTKNDKTNWSKVKKAFFWIDSGKEDQLTGYNLGFADIIDGKLQIVDRGVFAVAGGHGVTRIRAPSSAEKNQIKRKVNTLYRRMGAKWPKDEFTFEPPFPEVKADDMDTDTEVDTMDPVTLLEEVSEKFFPSTFGATSFGELERIEAVQEAIRHVFKTVNNFEQLAYGIARQSETPEDLVSGLKSLTKEMVTIFEKMTFDKETKGPTDNDKGLTNFLNTSDDGPWEVKQKGNIALLKNEGGEQFFYGRFTNNIWDKENEVLISEAHEKFVDYLDSHPDEAPELWDWHEESTAKTHKAVWWDYADGFLHAIWPVTSEEALGIKAFMEEFEPGMSHGFRVLERSEEDPNQISEYRSFEASILPIEFAANEWTTFDLLKERKKGPEGHKMFRPEKQRALELLSLGKYKRPLGKASEEDAATSDEAGAQRKDIQKEGITMDKDNDKDKVVDQATEETPGENVAQATTEVPDMLALQASVVEGLELLSKQMKEIAGQVAINTKVLQGIKETKGQSPSVAAWVAAQKAQSSVGKKDDPDTPTDGEIKDNDPLFGSGPEETAFEIEGHLLAGL